MFSNKLFALKIYLITFTSLRLLEVYLKRFSFNNPTGLYKVNTVKDIFY